MSQDIAGGGGGAAHPYIAAGGVAGPLPDRYGKGDVVRVDKTLPAVGQAYPVPAVLLLAQDGKGLPKGKAGQQLPGRSAAHPDPIPCGVAGTFPDGHGKGNVVGMDKPFSAIGQAYPVPAVLLLAQDGEGLPEGKTGQQLARGGSAHPDPIPCGVAGALCNSRRFLQFDIIRAGVSVAAARQPDTVPAVYFAYHLHPLILDIVAYDLAL